MATEQAHANITMIASGALVANTFCKAHTVANTAIVAEDGTGVLGVVAMDTASGEAAPIMSMHGAVVPIELGATLAADDFVMPSTAGVAIALTGVDAIGAGQLIQGGDDGDIVEMVFFVIRGVSA